MVRRELEKKEYVWQKKRRRSADKGKGKDRRKKFIDGIVVQDYERRLDDETPYDGDEKRSGKDRRKGRDRRK